MSRGRTFWQKVKKQRVRSLSPRDLSFMSEGGNGWCKWRGGGSLHLMQLRMGG